VGHYHNIGTLNVCCIPGLHRCIEDRISGKVFTTEDNNFSDHALTVYIMTVTALEAFINELCFGPSSKMLNKDRIPVEFFEDMEIRRKYYLLPLLLWGRTFDRGAPPYQDFEILIRLRNSLVHYKETHNTKQIYATRRRAVNV